jgi:hypothetical protein
VVPGSRAVQHAKNGHRHRSGGRDDVVVRVLVSWVLVLDGADDGLGFRWAGVLALLAWILVTAIGTLPINTLQWRPDAPPANWRLIAAPRRPNGSRGGRSHGLPVFARRARMMAATSTVAAIMRVNSLRC